MVPDHEVAGAVAAICLQDLWHLNEWILRICNRLRQPCRWRLADSLIGGMHLVSLDGARSRGCRRGCCHLFARPLTFECMDLEDLQQIAATVQVKTSWLACLVVCILRRLMAPDYEVAGAVAAICLQDLWHLNVWILRICNRLRQPCRWRLACLVVCILRRLMAPDHEVAGAVAAICLQDLWHLNVWILRICNRLRQPCRWRLAE